MWVLSTNRAELHWFPSPEEVPDGYAALSHVWNSRPEDGPPEQSFQDLQRIQKRCALSFTKRGRNPRNVVCEKIRRCCELAESHGYKWIWIDTCCIDKTSSAELSEAINSMYRYYSLARICYGYLRDVSDEKVLHHSIWFQRGWTLQELIAPRFLIFLSQTWQVLGSKADFAESLESRVRIPATVLRLEVSHADFSIAQRMSWFGRRQTTRLEDEAYCLLGLFDIHMSPLYGEGRNAFRRLQEELMKQSSDTTLFAWEDWGAGDDVRSCLLAASPSAFMDIHIAYTPARFVSEAQPGTDRRYSDSGTLPLLRLGVEKHMSFSVTPDGILACVPIVVCGGSTFADLNWSVDDGTRWSRALLCLEAIPSTDQAHMARGGPSYRVGPSRMERIEPPAQRGRYIINGRSAFASWETVLIKHRPSPDSHRLSGQVGLSDPRVSTLIPPMPMQLMLKAPFRFPESSVQRFLHQFRGHRVEVRNARLQSPGTTNAYSRTTYIFRRASTSWGVAVQVGQCRWTGPHREWPRRPVPVWAMVSTYQDVSIEGTGVPTVLAEMEPPGLSPDHDCLEDHVANWSALRKTFTVGDTREGGSVQLSFTHCPINPEGTLLLDASYASLGPQLFRPPVYDSEPSEEPFMMMCDGVLADGSRDELASDGLGYMGTRCAFGVDTCLLYAQCT